MSELYQLPDGWEWKKLDEIKVSNTIGLVKNQAEQSLEHPYKYVKMNNITNDNRFTLDNITNVKATAEEVKKYSLLKGDLLFNTRNSNELVGKSCIYDLNELLLYNNNIMRVRFKSNVNSYFIGYQFSSNLIQGQLNNIKSGTTNVSAIYYKELKDIIVIIPPLSEQDRIVQKLDALFERVDKAIALLQQNIDAADNFMNSVLNDVFSDLEQNHPYLELDKTVDFGGKNIVAINNPDLIYLSLEDIEANTGKIINYRTVSEAGVIGTSVLFDNDCVLYSKLRPYLNKVTIPDVNGCATTELVVIKPHNNLFKYFVSYFLRNPMVVNFLNNDSMGTKMPRTNMKTFKKLNIPVPEYGMQVKVVAYLDNISAQIEQIKSAQQQKMQNLLNLKSSILDQAFHGMI